MGCHLRLLMFPFETLFTVKQTHLRFQELLTILIVPKEILKLYQIHIKISILKMLDKFTHCIMALAHVGKVSWPYLNFCLDKFLKTSKNWRTLVICWREIFLFCWSVKTISHRVRFSLKFRSPVEKNFKTDFSKNWL